MQVTATTRAQELFSFTHNLIVLRVVVGILGSNSTTPSSNTSHKMDHDELPEDVSVVFALEEGIDEEEAAMSDEDIDEDVDKNKPEESITSSADTRSSMPVFAILGVSWMALMAIPAVTAFRMLDKADIETSLVFGFVVIPTFLGFLLLFVYLYNRKIKEFNNTDTNAAAKTSESVTSEDDANEEMEKCEVCPQDTYSIFAYYSPSQNTEIFSFALIIIFIQLALLVIILLSVTVPRLRAVGEVDNKDDAMDDNGNRIFGWPGYRVFPSNCSDLVRATQVVSIMAYFFFPDASLSDITTAFELFPLPLCGDKSDPERAGKLTRLRWSCFFRFLQGMLSAITVWLLVMTSSDVIEIILNFTAVNFISELDDKAFERALEGDYGPSVEKAAKGMKGEKLPVSISKKSKHKRYKYAVSFYTFALCMSTIAVMVFQNSSKIWVTPTVRVQFEDEPRSSYNGCYDIDASQKIYDRYIYEGSENNAKPAKLGYCNDERRWLFFENKEKPCDAYGTENEIAHSAKMDTYDIKLSISEDWFTPLNIPIDDIYFIQGQKLTKTNCEAFPSNGLCDDEFLNNFEYQYDGGDCCAMTCIGNCTSDNDEFCKDPSMTPFTIRIDSDISTRKEAVLKLDCISGEEKYEVFTYDTETVPNQAKWKKPAMVRRGSNCTLYLLQDEKGKEEENHPLNYSVYHGYDIEGVTGNEAFAIFSATTEDGQNETETTASFEVPRKLKLHWMNIYIYIMLMCA